MKKGTKKMDTTEKARLRESGYVPVAEAATKAGVSAQTVYSWLNNSLIAGITVGSHRYVLWTSVVEHYRVNDPRAVEVLGLKEEV
jgi:DNA invertase Pin-like site-specific DNA recombinase